MKNNETNEKPALSKMAVMPRCSTCYFWDQTSFFNYENVVNSGTCRELKMKIDFIYFPERIDGFVDKIETEGDFGCVLHNSI